MKYVVLVSHGIFAPGLQSVLEMLAGGEREDVISIGLKNGMSADKFAVEFLEKTKMITSEDEMILLGDIIGGSPLTKAIEQLAQKDMIKNTLILGGMNLPMALTATLMKDGMNLSELKEQVLNEAKDAMKEFVMTSCDEEDDI